VRDLLVLDWVDHRAGTFFEGVAQLPPGHWIALGPQGFRLERWWQLDPAQRASGSPKEWEREFEHLFTDAVRLRLLRADVEVGSCLSGGLDSSAVVTTAAKQQEKPLHTFTCAYDEGPAFDERPYVKVVAEAAGATSQVVVPSGDDFWETFDRIAAAQDEPTAGPGLYSQWKVMDLAARAKLKVLLDGQGGDETLAGYGRYLPMRLRDRFATGDFAGFAQLWSHVADRLGVQTTLGLVFEPWLPAALVEPLRRRFGQGKDRVLGPTLRRLPPAPRPIANNAFPTALSRQLAFDTLERLLPSLLRYEDRNSMAFGIETRLPFLDYRLVEFVFSLPDEQKLEGSTTKAILRRALADRIPKPVLDRRDKMGFETPTDLWLRGRHAGEMRRRLTMQGPLHEWIEPSSLSDALDDYLAGRRPIGYQVWRWLALDAWARRFITGETREEHRTPRVPPNPIHRRLRTRWVRPAA
jgi:asparagine synthase (glutamine-hydrolysing)